MVSFGNVEKLEKSEKRTENELNNYNDDEDDDGGGGYDGGEEIKNLKFNLLIFKYDTFVQRIHTLICVYKVL